MQSFYRIVKNSLESIMFFKQVRLWSWLQKPLQTKEKTSKKVSSFFISLQCSSSPKFHEIVYFPLFFATLCDMRRTQQWDAGTQPILCQKAWEEKIAPLLIDAKSCLSLWYCLQCNGDIQNNASSVPPINYSIWVCCAYVKKAKQMIEPPPTRL